MKKTIQTKRNKTAGPGFRRLYAKVGRKRRLSAATAAADSHMQIDSEVPNVGAGRALLVILMLHLIAIAAVLVHTKWSGNGEEKTAVVGADSGEQKTAVETAKKESEKEANPKKSVRPAAKKAPVADQGSRYIVVTGDTYHRISKTRNVDEAALRALNDERPLRAGVVLDLPAELSSRPVDPVMADVPDESLDSEVSVSGETPSRDVAPVAPVASTDVSGAPKAVVVKPKVNRAAAQSNGAGDSGQRYTVKSGDTLWRISSRLKVSQKKLLDLNGIKDANKLRVGQILKIPTR